MTSPGLMREPSIIRARSTTPTMQPARSYSPASIHSRHLRRFAADQGATTGAARFRETAQDLIENARLEFLRPDVIEKEERARAEDGDVVDAMIDEIGPDGVVPIHRKGDLQFRPDAVDAADQDRLAHSGKVRREQAAEAADLARALPGRAFAGRVPGSCASGDCRGRRRRRRGRRLFSSLSTDFTDLRRFFRAAKLAFSNLRKSAKSADDLFQPGKQGSAAFPRRGLWPALRAFP